MFDKFAVSCIKTGYKAKDKLKKLTSGEEGMETLETIIIIAIAVIVAGFIINFLTKGKFGDSEQGLVGYIFEGIYEKLESIFGTNTDSLAPIGASSSDGT